MAEPRAYRIFNPLIESSNLSRPTNKNKQLGACNPKRLFFQEESNCLVTVFHQWKDAFNQREFNNAPF